MTGHEAVKLWQLYLEVRSLYEGYNGILLEDDPAWKELTDRADTMIRDPGCSDIKQKLILFTVAELERMAKKRSGTYE